MKVSKFVVLLCMMGIDQFLIFERLNQEIKVAAGHRLSIIDKENRTDLLGSKLESAPGTRAFVKQEDIVKNSSQMTESLTRLTRNMARNVDQSGQTIRSLG
jgi:hypothetical protein